MTEVNDHRGVVVVLTALQVEFSAVRALLTNPRLELHRQGTSFEVGEVPGTSLRVALAVVGEGNHAAAVLTERARELFTPAAVLFVGVAGALKDDIGLGDVVVATRVYGYHGGKEDAGGFSARPRAYEASHALEQLARRVDLDGTWLAGLDASRPSVHFKPVAAGEVVLNSRTTPLAVQLRTHYGDAAAVEMESAGAAHAAHLGAVPVLTVRGISDKADGDKQAADATGSQLRAAAHAAAFAIAVVALLDAVNGQGRPPWHGWRPLPQPVHVVWRADLEDLQKYQMTALELHLVPVGTLQRLEYRRLDALPQELAALGLERKLLPSVEETSGWRVRDSAIATSYESRYGPAGIAAHRAGQRSAWTPLPKGAVGYVLDEADVTKRVHRLLAVLLRLDMPAPDEVVPVVGLDPAFLVREGRLPATGGPQSGFAMHQGPVRTDVDEAVPFRSLHEKPDAVVEELVARLRHAFRQSRR